MADDGIDVAMDLVGIAVRIEPGLDVRPFGPFPESFFAFFVGIEFFQFEPFVVEGEALRGKIPAAESRQPVAKLPEASPSELRILFIGDHGLG